MLSTLAEQDLTGLFDIVAMRIHTKVTSVPRTIIGWWSAAIFTWLISVPLCFGLAHDLVSAPPPNLQTWKTVAELLPVGPILVALTIALVAALGRRKSSRVAAVAAQGLLWCSIAIVLLAIPKAS